VGRLLLDHRRDLPAAATAFERSLRLATPLGDHSTMSWAALTLSRIAWERSRYREALLWGDRAAREADLAGDPVLARSTLFALSRILFEVGDLDGGRNALAAASRRQAPPHPIVDAALALHDATISKVEGSPSLARLAFERAIALAKAARRTAPVWEAQLNLVEIALDSGDPARAAADLEVARPFFESTGCRAIPSRAWSWLSRPPRWRSHRAAPARRGQRCDPSSSSRRHPSGAGG
jgi:ATP/maltotriose-dependent transcriptional regulator MalT